MMVGFDYFPRIKQQVLTFEVRDDEGWADIGLFKIKIILASKEDK